MNDTFASATDSVTAPARRAFAITPNDSADLNAVTKAIYVGTGGTVVVQLVDSVADVVFANVQSGSILDLRCIAVRATGTTAANIVGLA